MAAPTARRITSLMMTLRQRGRLEMAELCRYYACSAEEAENIAEILRLLAPVKRAGASIIWEGAMPRFSRRSLEKLSSCEPELQRLFKRVVQKVDCTILVGHRTRAEQERLYKLGRSRLHWPHSKHNSTPSRAVDVAPYPISWDLRDPKTLKRYYYLAGFVLGTAREMGIPIRWGGDWDMDSDLSDQHFYDLVHYELV